LLGTKLSFVPITQIAPHGDQLRVPHENHRIKDAPSIDPGVHGKDDQIREKDSQARPA
jgi:hypothetical protein